MKESSGQFESRKKDHLRLALDSRTQAQGQSGLNQVKLVHEALPDLNLSDVNLKSEYWGQSVKVPLFISSMTAGHTDSIDLNTRLAKAAEFRGWAMGVGSQRRELTDLAARAEWAGVRKSAPNAVLFGNLGITQLVTAKLSDVQALVESLSAKALFIHLNPLQECLQPEGTPDFRGALKKLEEVCKALPIPVIAKEVGCGISAATAQKLFSAGVAAVDVAGMGGTHWGRLEGFRNQEMSLKARAAETFSDWGLSTIESLLEVRLSLQKEQIWASGGVRTGLDAAKLIALGADKVGLAQPILKAALQSEEALLKEMEQFEFELKVALFCTGCATPLELKNKKLWRWV